MSDDPSRPIDVKAAWRGQAREVPPMALEQVRAEALRSQGRLRRAVILGPLIAMVLILALIPSLFSPLPLMKAWGALAIAWAVFYIWKRHRMFPAQSVPDDATACLDFHLGVLRRQREAIRSAWRWLLAPLIPISVLLVIARWTGPPPPWRAVWVDHLIIAVAWVFVIETWALCWLWMLRGADKREDRIEALEALGKDRP